MLPLYVNPLPGQLYRRTEVSLEINFLVKIHPTYLSTSIFSLFNNTIVCRISGYRNNRRVLQLAPSDSQDLVLEVKYFKSRCYLSVFYSPRLRSAASSFTGRDYVKLYFTDRTPKLITYWLVPFSFLALHVYARPS